jgi:hypothetical protein
LNRIKLNYLTEIFQLLVLLPRIFWKDYQKPQTVKDLTEGENHCAEFREIQ